MENKLIFAFSKDKTDGDSSLNTLLGGKGANLAEMSKMGIPVPPGFTITTEVCNYFTERCFLTISTFFLSMELRVFFI